MATDKYQLICLVTLFSFLKLGASFNEWIEEEPDNASKKMLPTMQKFFFSTSKGKFVYLIGTIDGPFFKIGYSENPENRVKQLQTGSMYILQLVKKWPVTNMCKAEEDAHVAMQKYNRALRYPSTGWKTEWFDLKGGLTLKDVEEQVSSVLEKYKPGPNEI